MICLFCISVLLGVCFGQDPCTSAIKIGNPRRSVKFQPTDDIPLISDNSITPDVWYRFDSYSGGKMPESCVTKYHCGTASPVWINGTHPTEVGGSTSVQVCASDHTGCCAWSSQIGITRCEDGDGTEFFVYRLVPTKPNSAYCAGDGVVCRSGFTWNSITGQCQLDFFVGKETRDKRGEDSTHNLEGVIWSMMSRVEFARGEQKSQHMEQILETLLNITAAQERTEIELRQDIENMREQNRGLIANMTEVMERKESHHKQDIEDLRKGMREENRGLISNITKVLEGQHKQEIEDLRKSIQEQNRGLIANMTAVLEKKETEPRREMEGLKEQIRDLQTNVTTEIKRRGSEQEERLKNISATSEKDVHSLKFICSAGPSILILRNDVAGSNSNFFNRSWAQYKQGFGNPYSRYWIGLDRLHEVSRRNCKIQFELQLLSGPSRYAQYSRFSVGGPSSNYTLTIGGYSGDLSDAMAWHNNRQFSTYDVNNDAYYRSGSVTGNCARELGGGFWFGWCAYAHITTSPAMRYFYWYSSSNASPYKLSSVEVRLLC